MKSGPSWNRPSAVGVAVAGGQLGVGGEERDSEGEWSPPKGSLNVPGGQASGVRDLGQQGAQQHLD